MKLGSCFKSVGTAVTAGIIGFSSCAKTELKVAQEVDKVIAHKLDSVRKSTQEILKNPEYQLISRDTIPLPKFFNYVSSSLTTNMNSNAYKVVPKVVVGDSNTKIRKFVNETGVITSDKLFAGRNNQLYVPVEYYGIINPKLK